MNIETFILASLSCLTLVSCFKKPGLNENALLQERACIESISIDDYGRALVHCELCLEFNKASPECLNGIGLIALQQNDEEKAIVYFSRALRQNNDFTQAYNNLGVIEFSRGNFAKAKKFFSRALAIDPSNADARNNNGLSFLRLAQRFKAQGKSKLSLENLIKAKDQFNKLIALEPTYASAYRDLGVVELNRYDLSEYEEERQKMLSASRKAFELCLSIDVDNDACFEGLAQVSFEQGRFDNSFANYFLCLAHAPNNSSCRTGIVQSFEKSAQAEGGYKQFREKIKLEPKNALAHEAFCAALFERGLDSEARQECETALRLDPSLCSAHYRLADHHAALLDAKKAIHHCRTFLICDGSKETIAQQSKCREILVSLKE